MRNETDVRDGDTYVDAALFLGMNSTDETIRLACKGFFVARLHDRVVMSLEQVGRCDDLVWGFPRDIQDAYYPFMDNLHSCMNIERRGYDVADLAWIPSDDPLPAHERLLLSTVINRRGVLYTASPRLLDRRGLPVRTVAATRSDHARVPDTEPVFPEPLERLYQASLALRVSTTLL